MAETRSNNHSVTRETIRAFGLRAKAHFLESDQLSQEVRGERSNDFGAGEKWCRNLSTGTT